MPRDGYSRRRLSARAIVLALVLPFAATACNDILDVHVPGRVQEEALDDPSLAPRSRRASCPDFECAWNNYVAAAALISDEFIQASGNLNQRNWGSRRITADDPNMAQGNCRTQYGIYTTLQTARFQAEDIFKRSTSSPTRRCLIGGPQGDREGLRRVRPARTRRRVLRDGARRRTAHDTEGSTPTRGNCIYRSDPARDDGEQPGHFEHGARRACESPTRPRELRRSDRDAKLVPPTYVKNATRDDSDVRRYDALCEYIACAQMRHATVAPNYRQVTWAGVPDPRVAVSTRNQLAFDNAQIHYYPTNKHTSRSYPVVIASAREARLIVAEASARNNDLATARDLINAMHAAAGIPPYDAGRHRDADPGRRPGHRRTSSRDVHRRRSPAERPPPLRGHSVGDPVQG
jgi:hypothetical protein